MRPSGCERKAASGTTAPGVAALQKEASIPIVSHFLTRRRRLENRRWNAPVINTLPTGVVDPRFLPSAKKGSFLECRGAASQELVKASASPRNELCGCQAGAATEGRPYRVDLFFANTA